MLSDACFEFLEEMALCEGVTPSALERLLGQIGHYSDEAFGYSAPFLTTLYGYVLSVLEDVVDGRNGSVMDLIGVVQCVQRAYDAPPAGAEGSCGPLIEPALAPCTASLKWTIEEAVVRRRGRLTMLAQVAAAGTTGQSGFVAGGTSAS